MSEDIRLVDLELGDLIATLAILGYEVMFSLDVEGARPVDKLLRITLVKGAKKFYTRVLPFEFSEEWPAENAIRYTIIHLKYILDTQFYFN